MSENKSVKAVRSGPKPWHELTEEERNALRQECENDTERE